MEEKENNYFKESNQQKNVEKIADFWNYRAKQYAKDAMEKQGSKQNLVEFFLRYPMVSKDSSVLDIGCGPGIQAIALAKHCKAVVALDLAEEMLAIARENAEKAGIHNIHFEKSPWQAVNLEEYQWRRRFDLVYASMTPGVYDFDTLKKMTDASRRYCFISSFVKRQDYILDEILKELEISSNPSQWEEKIYCSFNTLWKMGYYPELRYIDRSWTMKMSLEEAIAYYVKRIEILSGLSEKERVTKFLQNYMQENDIEEKIQGKVAWMNWEV